ncbi:MAG: hypothetical protein OEZ47_15950 [Gammaproteobacteria bacterium]|nr:hypothetical protein [Gammaproteobacteria bacterium]
MKEVNNIRELEELIGLPLSRYYPEARIDHKAIALGHLMENLAKYVKKGDALAIEDSCKLISLDPHMPFGKRSKSNLARSLKKSAKYINESNRAIIIRKTASLLSLEFCPREAEDYCSLIRKLGSDAVCSLVSLVTPINEKSLRLVSDLECEKKEKN